MTGPAPLDSAAAPGRVLALCGGIGGAKLALGLYRVLAPDRLTVVVNTGDDFEHLGLHISPDLDTVLYTLAGCNNPETGWGRAEETWSFMEALAALGGETWFKLGDKDLALHVARSRRLRAGENLSAITADIARRLGIGARVLPMSDDPLRTVVETPGGALPFQEYFVKLGCAPRLTGLTFAGAADARPHPDILAALAQPDLRAVVICPSNPYLSIDPILALPGLRGAIAASSAPVVAVSPIVGRDSVKGPLGKILRELGEAPASATVARHYRGLLDGLVLDLRDADDASAIPVATHVTETLMRSLADREALAREVLGFADNLRTTAKFPSERRAGAAR